MNNLSINLTNGYGIQIFWQLWVKSISIRLWKYDFWHGDVQRKKRYCHTRIRTSEFLLMETCIKAGINYFDTAEVYGLGVSEMLLGLNLKQGG